MFGLKIVKSQDYKDLRWRLEQALALIDEKDTRIAELNDTISKKETELNNYKNRVKKLEKDVMDADAPKKAILLTDVAETPLIEEPKSEGKPKRVVKKTCETKPRRNVIRKTDEQ